jgi:hypothetical protein
MLDPTEAEGIESEARREAAAMRAAIGAAVSADVAAKAELAEKARLQMQTLFRLGQGAVGTPDVGSAQSRGTLLGNIKPGVSSSVAAQRVAASTEALAATPSSPVKTSTVLKERDASTAPKQLQ